MTYTEMELLEDAAYTIADRTTQAERLEAVETFVLRLEQATQNLSKRERLQIKVRLAEELQHMQ